MGLVLSPSSFQSHGFVVFDLVCVIWILISFLLFGF